MKFSLQIIFYSEKQNGVEMLLKLYKLYNACYRLKQTWFNFNKNDSMTFQQKTYNVIVINGLSVTLIKQNNILH